MADNSIEQRRKEMENQLRALQQQVDSMDAKLRAYLADRENKPHPRHQELVERVQRFRIDPRISSKHLETLLDNLQWKVYYYNRAWRQLWENAEAVRRAQAREARGQQSTDQKETNSNKNGGHSAGGADNRPIYSVDRLWDIQRQKLDEAGAPSNAESKEDFVQRIKQRYGKLASEKQEDEEIVMKFDKTEKRCTLALKKQNPE
ncbi:MAG: hypothetical protein ACQERN_06930 [Thermodesulfobacteriota bacterium]